MRKTLFLLFIFLSFLQAHSVKIFATNDENNLQIKTYFYGGSACKKCKIEIFSKDELLNSFYSDENGTLNIALPKKDKIIIKVNAGSGHFKQIEYEIKSIQNSTPKDENLTQNSMQNLLIDFIKSFSAIVIIFAFFAIIFFIKSKKNAIDNSGNL